ncbi:hypothetical protein QUF44_12360 [Bacillus subtilis]|nr:hypothetical protein [Bacillus subtilis]MDM5302368.1 hypothetical protein [Bacillus subtilis]MDM5324421.1 hypothetical protein [Bacillus subtilis]
MAKRNRDAQRPESDYEFFQPLMRLSFVNTAMKTNKSLCHYAERLVKKQSLSHTQCRLFCRSMQRSVSLNQRMTAFYIQTDTICFHGLPNRFEMPGIPASITSNNMLSPP